MRGMPARILFLACIVTMLSACAFIGLLCSPVQSDAQVLSPPQIALTSQAVLPHTRDALPLSSKWEVSLEGQVGVPGGHIKVGEFDVRGTRLRLRDDLGIDTSEALELSVKYRFTPRDALRVTSLYYFLDGTTTVDHPVAYNGQTFPPGRLRTTADFFRLTVAYERLLRELASGMRLAGSAGLTYVYFNPKVNDNSEDFFRQELPVPLVGLRVDAPLRGRLGVTAFLEGGGLPKVNSLRREGGTVWLQQAHVDAGLGLTYAVTPATHLHLGYRLTYFFQHEKSHEDDNLFQFIDNAVRLGVTFRF